ncbi:unnamed protein product [Larinioides sclopetarius]|uniref:Uncharacterized protein n=1 Tax=Larinioides sclopetarius TaxID=280406 RepID=A0AAV2BWM7_9ARAC
MWKTLGAIVLLCTIHQAFGETGCPEQENIVPCVCTQAPFTYLLCENLTDEEELRNVFIHSERYRYKEVHIEHSSLQYLPHDIFETVRVIELYLKNVTLAQLFDRPPQALDELRTLDIDNSRVMRGLIWKILEPLKSLRTLTVSFNTIKTLGRDFSTYATKDLEQLTFYKTGIKTIKPGTFANFTKLDKIEIDGCNLRTLTRDIFPTPFNGRVLYFNNNKISTIPEGLFSQMPNLQTLGLRKNLISTLPKKAFDSADSVSRIEYLFLDDNPLKCDCLLVWLMEAKPAVLQGKCASPKRLQDKELKDLDSTDFNC